MRRRRRLLLATGGNTMVLDNTHMSYRSPMVSNTNGQYGYGQNNGYNNQQGMYNNRGQNQGYNNGNPNPIAQGIY